MYDFAVAVAAVAVIVLLRSYCCWNFTHKMSFRISRFVLVVIFFVVVVLCVQKFFEFISERARETNGCDFSTVYCAKAKPKRNVVSVLFRLLMTLPYVHGPLYTEGTKSVQNE